MVKKMVYAGIIAVGLLFSSASFAQNKEEKEVAEAVDRLKKAMIDADSATLASLTLDQLSYGHSAGKVEDKKDFIQAFTSGKSDFVTIDLTEQTIQVVKNTAIVRHILSAQTNDAGKLSTVKIAVMTVWFKENGSWKLLARQAVRI